MLIVSVCKSRDGDQNMVGLIQKQNSINRLKYVYAQMSDIVFFFKTLDVYEAESLIFWLRWHRPDQEQAPFFDWTPESPGMLNWSVHFGKQNITVKATNE